jgi:hypothetical protein
MCFEGFGSHYIEYSNLMADPLLENNCANRPLRAKPFCQFAEQTQDGFISSELFDESKAR